MTLDEIEDELISLMRDSSDVDAEEVTTVMKTASQSEHSFAYHALERDIVDDYSMRGFLEEATGYEAFDPTYVDWDEDDKEEFTRLFPYHYMRENMVFPINKQENEVGVIMQNPSDTELIRDIQARTGCHVHPYVSHEKGFKDAFEMNFGDEEPEKKELDYEKNGYFFEPIDELREEVNRLINEDDEWKEDDDAFDEILHRTPVMLLVQEIMNQIMYDGGSDIHFETMETRLRIRVRRDGELRTLWKFPKSFANIILGRIRLASDLEPRTNMEDPEDARIGYTLILDSRMEYRVSCLPTLHGEKIVLRSIELDEGTIPLDVMGFSERDLDVLTEGYNQPTGMVLVTGPTGSGKTTTLYSILDERNEENVSITTAEDPVEAQIEGVAQVSCAEEESEGVTFAQALKSFLRQDPDIIMVGEIRDRETGEIAIEAAMTGHLVLSTLHTNGAAETINRLLNMNIKPYLINAGLSVVEAQRLLRTLCDECKYEAEPPTDVMKQYNKDPSEFEDFTFYDADGCEACDNGFDGRTGIFEVIKVDDSIAEGILNQESTQGIAERARDQGFTTLYEDGLRKVKKGVTTLEEVLKQTV
ncbi:MAG: GspE/PulE family protein [bacterium]